MGVHLKKDGRDFVVGQKHKERGSGAHVVCYECKNDNHSECVNESEHADILRCHCACQPVCERPECLLGKRTKLPRKPTCGRCFLSPCCCDPEDD